MFRYLFKRVLAPDNDAGGGAGDDDGKGADDKGADDKGADDKATILGSGDDKGAGDDKGQAGEWAWSENNPGDGTMPPWFQHDKYKTIADQAQAATSLAEKLGPSAELIGAPEADYEMPELPEGTEGEWDAKDPMFSAFREIAKEMNLSQAAHDKIVQKMGHLMATEQAAEEVSIADALSTIGVNAAAQIQAVDNYIKATVGQEAWKSLTDAIGTDVGAYQALAIVVGKASGDAQLAQLGGKTGPAFTKADIEAERYKLYPSDHKLAGKSIYENDKEHRAKVTAMYKELFPGEDREEVG